MNQSIYIYYILVLKNLLIQFFGQYYPSDIINKIIMINYTNTKIICGDYNTFLIGKKMYAWGDNDNNKISSIFPAMISCPTEFVFRKKIDSICSRFDYTICLTTTGSLYSWGMNECGQLGLGHTNNRKSPQKINLHMNKPIGLICCGRFHSIASVKSSSNAYVWGGNKFGQLGLGDTQQRTLPTLLKLPGEIISISSGFFYCAVLIKSRSKLANSNFNIVYAWGRNVYGQLGLGHDTDTYSPQKIVLSVSVESVSCGGCHVMALTTNGEIYSWGRNNYGQLGLGHQRPITSPQKIKFDFLSQNPLIVSISCGVGHTVCLSKSGLIYSWGKNKNGQLGRETSRFKKAPCQLALKNVILVTCGLYHTIALTADNKIYVWGLNSSAQLGLGHEKNQFSLQKLDFEFDF